MESDAPIMSAPAVNELPAGCSKRASDIPRGEVDLPWYKKKESKGERGPIANAKDLVQEQFCEITPETTSTI